MLVHPTTVNFFHLDHTLMLTHPPPICFAPWLHSTFYRTTSLLLPLAVFLCFTALSLPIQAWHYEQELGLGRIVLFCWRARWRKCVAAKNETTTASVFTSSWRTSVSLLRQLTWHSSKKCGILKHFPSKHFPVLHQALIIVIVEITKSLVSSQAKVRCNLESKAGILSLITNFQWKLFDCKTCIQFLNWASN